MYTDTILFIVGGIFFLLTMSLGLYLALSHKRSRTYRSILRQETELLDALATTVLLTQSTKSNTATGETTELLTTGNSERKRGTHLILEYNTTEILNEEHTETVDFDASALEGRYILRCEIFGGGMSRVFLAESAKLGNRWIVKFIPHQIGELANEENILKLLNHRSLPSIVDIFHDDKGVYIVESFVEGVSLDKVMESVQKTSQTIILDWAKQLVQVLKYLHKMEPHPIYHFDLKPSNIMVTHDNRLVLIDFGISKRFGEDDPTAIGVTYNYAAPEQLRHRIPDKHKPIIKNRFGELPADRLYWTPDARTDIYSLGVIMFELAVGQIPITSNLDLLKRTVSNELSNIIYKCLEIAPNERYQSADDLLPDLQKVKNILTIAGNELHKRKLVAVLTGATIMISGCSLTGGYYIYGQENAALLEVKPEIVTVSLQQSNELVIEKQMPNGKHVVLDNSQIRWAFSQDNIARIDGNRIFGMNAGYAELSGRYRNKTIGVNINVVEPMNGVVDISQRYQTGHIVQIFAGTTEREHTDGTLADAEFVSPESISVADDGTIYIADSGLLRKIHDGQVESINFEPGFLTPRIVRCYKNEVYVLTHEWEDDEGVYYGIIKLTGDSAEGLYMADAKFTAIDDFTFSSDGLIYFIDRNEGVGQVSLRTLDPANIDDIRTLCELPKSTSALTLDEHGAVYLANPETGVVQVWENGKLNYFAGIENEKAFIDGQAPLFYEPQKIKYEEGFLFVWDFNVLRRIGISDGVATETITIAGEASPTFELDITQTTQVAEEVVLPNSKLMDFAVKDNGVLLTDPKRGVVWKVE